tara:strand:- start:10606 stop:11061 length:456 start_codon:yes stop_codon:yes gene_type:complete
MSTTITPSTLTVQIKEEITINGTAYDQTVSKQLTGIKEVSKRIHNIPAATTVTLNTFASAGDGSNFDVEEVKYIRLTNLDDTENLIVTTAFSATSGALEIKAGCSITLFSPNGLGATSKAAITTQDDIETLFVRNNHGGNDVDLEVFIATT